MHTRVDMENPFIEFERKYGLSASQVSTLLGFPRPTYYQYRRGGNAPSVATRYIEIMLALPKRAVFDLLGRFIGDASDEEL